jgi:hypothetical protein
VQPQKPRFRPERIAEAPESNIDFSPFLPQAGMTAPIPSNTLSI